MTTTDNKWFTEIWEAAKVAAQRAAEEQDRKLADENSRGFDCGFAWVGFPGNIPFGRWAKKQGIASAGYPSGLQIWYSKLHSVPTQSISVHEAAARAARDVIAHALQTSQIYASSRLD